MLYFPLALGLILVLATWGSLVATFVLPRGRTHFQRASWGLTWGVYRAAVACSRPLGEYQRRDAVLATAGPVALIIQLGAFLTLFVLGTSLTLWAWTNNYPLALQEAAAGVFTVGLVAVSAHTNDVLMVIAAASGGVTIALQIGYLPALYQSFARRETLVALMESRAGVPAWGPEVLIRHQLVSSVDALPDLYRDWELWAADVAESHSTHPTLLLFRSPVAGYSWLLSLLAVLDAAAIQLASCPATAPSSARMCLRMGFTTLRRIATTFGLDYDPDPSPAGPIDLSEDEFASALAQLSSAGFPLERSAHEAYPHFVGWRVNYESIAYRLADELVAPKAPWSGPRRHLRDEVMLPNRPPHRSPDGSVSEAWRFRPPR